MESGDFVQSLFDLSDDISNIGGDGSSLSDGCH